MKSIMLSMLCFCLVQLFIYFPWINLLIEQAEVGALSAVSRYQCFIKIDSLLSVWLKSSYWTEFQQKQDKPARA